MLPEDSQSRNLNTTLAQVDSLVSAGNFEEAQNRLLTLRQDFPTSDEIRRRLDILDPLVRSAKFARDGKTAFDQGEYGEAVRALTQALELNPQDRFAQELKARALAERDRLRQVREALSAGQRAMRDGDTSTAAIELQKVLQIDPAHSQAAGLIGQMQNVQAVREREARLRATLQQADTLATETKFEDAQYTLRELRQEFPDSAEIDQKLRALDLQTKLHALVTDGQQALDHGEYGEAVRILTEAQQLAPDDERIRDLKVRAVQERDRLRQVREAIAGGQRALREGEPDLAEKQFQRALQLDPANSQATSLLTQLVAGRQAREGEHDLKTGLRLAENLITGRKFEEAERCLEELQGHHPDSAAVTQMLNALRQRKAEAVMISPAPASIANSRPTVLPAPAADYAKSMELAEELRLSLLKPRAPKTAANQSAAVPAPSSSGAPDSPRGDAADPPVKRVVESSDVTLVMGSGFRSQAAPAVPAAPAALPTPVAIQPEPPLAPPAAPKVPPPAREKTNQVSVAHAKPARMSPMVIVALGILTAILAVVAFAILHHS